MYPSEQLTQPMSVDYVQHDLKLSSGGSPSPAAASLAVVTKPSRPLTAYHLYFQLEREHIIQTTKSIEDDDAVDQNMDDNRPFGLELDDEMPLRYHNIRLAKNWFASGKGKRSSDQKRKHRKTHGMISFLDLSKTIASRWATLEQTDPDTKDYCARVAKRELDEYKKKVKAYKASLADNPSDSLPSSFSSNGTVYSRASSSPIFNMSPVSAPALMSARTPSPLKSESQANYNSPTISYEGRGSHSSSLTISASNTTSFQLCSDFQPEWMNSDGLSPERPAKWARSSFPSTTMTSTNNSQADLSDWCPEPLPGCINQQSMNSQSAANQRNDVAMTTTNNTRAANEFTFHPVQCEAEDSFLKKYRKLARRTSLFSIRPLHHQVAPLSQSLSCDNSKSNIGLNDVMEYENLTNQSGQHPSGFGSIQRRLRTELDERMSFLKGGWRKGQVQSMLLPATSNEKDKKMAGKKRLSSSISETDRTDELMSFTTNDANMLIDMLALNDKERNKAP